MWRRWGGPVDFDRQIQIGPAGESLESGSHTREHFGAIESVGSIGGLVVRHVISIRPYAKLEVTGERSDIECIREVSAQRIGGLGDGNTQMVTHRKTSQQSPSSKLGISKQRVSRIARAEPTTTQKSQT